MAIDEFWGNIRNALSYFAPSKDALRIGNGSLEKVFGSATKWLTPRSVDGYDPNDFTFLDEDKQSALRAGVERFRAVAGQVSKKKPATRKQAEEGDAALRDILQILDPYTFRDAESFRTQVLMERKLAGKLPRWVTAVSCETGTDHTGEPGIWIWVDVTDDAVDKGKIEKHWHAIDKAVEAAYHQTGGRRWTFIRFRSPDAFAHK